MCQRVHDVDVTRGDWVPRVSLRRDGEFSLPTRWCSKNDCGFNDDFWSGYIHSSVHFWCGNGHRGRYHPVCRAVRRDVSHAPVRRRREKEDFQNYQRHRRGDESGRGNEPSNHERFLVMRDWPGATGRVVNLRRFIRLQADRSHVSTESIGPANSGKRKRWSHHARMPRGFEVAFRFANNDYRLRHLDCACLLHNLHRRR
mmetsp:Transcript_5440/g.17199  ORF Transcript_5440/g.17199 Transcript_5440/m.17199 type:complete len:200 (+) Transcript_5440:520-1119(+)